MNHLLFRSTNQIMKFLEMMIETQIELEGVDNIDTQSPMFFCSNHFTRLETFVMPNIFYQKLNLEVRSLADNSLFKGVLGEFISNLGSISTEDQRRDEVIISDLIQARHNWIIYPEGRMMKNKKVIRDKDSFMLEGPDSTHGVHTGSAVLALQSELEKRRFSQASMDGDLQIIDALKKEYDLEEKDRLAYRSTKIIPVTITYIPVHPGENIFMGFADTFLKEQTPMLLEELEIEGNILLNSKINIYLGEPINISHEIQIAKRSLELLGKEAGDAEIIEHCRHEITNTMMDRIYSNIKVHFDHLFVLILMFWDEKETLDINEFKTRLFILAHQLQEIQILRTQKLVHKEFYKILVDEPFNAFDEAFEIAQKQGIITRLDEKHIQINKSVLLDEHSFYDIRIKNTFLVMYHEVALLDILIDCAKMVVAKPRFELQKEAAFIIYEYDKKLFMKDYKKFYSVLHSKPKEVGMPFFLYNKDYSKGMVLSHGYKSAPKEVEALAHFLHEKMQFNVYAIRMRGHGTMPEDMRDRDWESWYDSFNRGYAVINQLCKKVYLGGFSTGGLLTLLASSRKRRNMDGLLCINAALKLKDIRFNYVLPTVSALNNFLSIFNADIEYVEDVPENPDINYAKHYLTSIGELKGLMEETEKVLDQIKAPILIIQGDNDPTVAPKSADIIYEKVHSGKKELVKVKSDFHVIITREEKKEVFKAIASFF